MRQHRGIIRNIEVKIFFILFMGYIVCCFLGLFIEIGVGSSGGLLLSSEPAINKGLRRIFYFFVLFVSLHYVKCKIFNNKAIYVLMFGVFGQLVFSLFATWVGLTLLPWSYSVFYNVLVSAFSYIIFFLSVRFVIANNLSMYLVRIKLLLLGTFLIGLYIINFDGLKFLNPDTLRAMFLSGGRYRYAFGLNHVNSLGYCCFFYLAFLAIYRHMRTLSSLNKNHKKGGGLIDFYLSWVCTPIVIIMLLSSASRSSITSIILFWMILYFINNYQRLGSRTKFMYIFISIILLFIIIFLVDWDFVYQQSGRERNYINGLEALQNINTLIVGLGLTGAGSEFLSFVGLAYVDSVYLANLLQTGILGCLFFFGSIFYFTRCYFRNINGLSKLHQLCGCLLIAMLYRGLFEGALFGPKSSFYFTAWLLIVICMNERKPLKHSMCHQPVLQ